MEGVGPVSGARRSDRVLPATPPEPASGLVPSGNAPSRVEQSPTVRRIVGPTILLHGGTYFDFLAPDQCEFTIEDVAHALSHVCRFAGHCRHFYSVAQHSVYVSQIVPPADAVAGLMHDAAEAFVGDVSKPLKDLLPEYRSIERRIEGVVLARFGLSLPLPASVKEADVVMLATEQRALMRNRDDWDYCRGRAPLDMVIPHMCPVEAKAEFLARYQELTRDRDAAPRKAAGFEAEGQQPGPTASPPLPPKGPPNDQ